MTFRHSSSAWIGNFIINPGFRGMGYGTRLLNEVIEYLTGSGVRTVYLTAAPRAVSLYRKMKFQEITTVHRWVKEASLSSDKNGDSIINGGIHYTEPDWHKIYLLDRHCWGDGRDLLLNQWRICRWCYQSGNGDAFLFLGKVNNYLAIGPWADRNPSGQDALVLLEQALSWATKFRKVVIDVPDVNKVATDILQSHGFGKQGKTLLMALGEVPDLALDSVFALASLGSMG